MSLFLRRFKKPGKEDKTCPLYNTKKLLFHSTRKKILSQLMTENSLGLLRMLVIEEYIQLKKVSNDQL